MYSSSFSLSASPRSSRHSPVQLVTPRMMHRNSRRRSARCAAVGNSSGWRVDVDLHHQHRRRDQQHAGNRIQRGVEILDHIVDPAAEVARDDAERERERQHHQRRQRADHEPGADAFQRQVEHVLADLVGAEHVIVGGQRDRRAGQHAERQQRQQDRAPRHVGLAAPDRAPRARQRHAVAARGEQRDQNRAQQPHGDTAGGDAAERGQRDVCRPLALRVLETAAPPYFRRGKSRAWPPPGSSTVSLA